MLYLSTMWTTAWYSHNSIFRAGEGGEWAEQGGEMQGGEKCGRKGPLLCHLLSSVRLQTETRRVFESVPAKEWVQNRDTLHPLCFFPLGKRIRAPKEASGSSSSGILMSLHPAELSGIRLGLLFTRAHYHLKCSSSPHCFPLAPLTTTPPEAFELLYPRVSLSLRKWCHVSLSPCSPSLLFLAFDIVPGQLQE